MKTIDNNTKTPVKVRLKPDVKALFNIIDSNNSGYITPDQLWQSLEKRGILRTDYRLRNIHKNLSSTSSGSEKKISLKQFEESIYPNTIGLQLDCRQKSSSASP